MDYLLAGVMFLNSIIPASVTEYGVQTVYAQEHIEIESETLEEKINRIAIAKGIATTTLYNLALTESSLGKQRVGDDGKSCGVVHFHKDYYPEEFARCGDDEFILNRAAEMIANGEDYKFTPCNCYQFVKIFVGNLPRMKEIMSNSRVPRVGGLIILDYNGLKHIAYLVKVSKDGIHVKEANFTPCLAAERLIDFTDKAIVGFYSMLPD
jgi:hypothetical protein